MKKLLFFITIFNCFSIVAMDQAALSEDLNAQDEQGNTALHNAVIAWQNCKQKDWECDAICRQLENAEDKASLEKAKKIAEEGASYMKQADSYKKTVVQLIEKGARVNIRNLHNKTVAALCPSLIGEFVYEPLQKAVTDGDVLAIAKYLRIGANPERTHGGKTPLQCSIESNKPESAKVLLFGGAKLTTTHRFGYKNITTLHLVANHGTHEMTEALLHSPQGSPSFYSSKYNLKKIERSMFTFLCCMHRNKKTLPTIPADVRRSIYRFVLPDPEMLIDLVPLQQILKYRKFLGKTTLVNALTKRHIELLYKVMNSYIIETSHFGNVIKQQLPHQFPRAFVWKGIDTLKDEEAVRRALDPANLEEHREVIEANYRKLLE